MERPWVERVEGQFARFREIAAKLSHRGPWFGFAKRGPIDSAYCLGIEDDQDGPFEAPKKLQQKWEPRPRQHHRTSHQAHARFPAGVCGFALVSAALLLGSCKNRSRMFIVQVNSKSRNHRPFQVLFVGAMHIGRVLLLGNYFHALVSLATWPITSSTPVNKSHATTFPRLGGKAIC